MQASRKPVSPSVRDDKQRAVALFKTSLRDWQARYQARRARPARGAHKVRSQAAPA